MASNQAHEAAAPLSQIDSELEKDKTKYDRTEEEEIEEETASTKEERLARQQRPLPVPLRNTRSRSSARSVKSYISHTDGYSHFNEANDEEKQRATAADGSENPDKQFEVTFDGDADPYNPKNRPYIRKWLIVIIVSASSLCVTCASALYTSTYKQLEEDFHVSREVATLGLTTFVCGLGLGPMFLSPLSEFYGRRIIYLCAFGMYFIWLIPCAVANNIATMLVVRLFDGLAGSAFLSVAGGTVGDMFNRDQLSAPMMVYTAAPFVGPEIGPVVGGFINQYTNWRWSFWVLVIWAGIQWTLIALFVPETYAPVLLRRKAIKLRKETGEQRIEKAGPADDDDGDAPLSLKGLADVIECVNGTLTASLAVVCPDRSHEQVRIEDGALVMQ
ncbi:hypothetical protein PRZ48_000646 [Zasmidium cellare]|uniref:Major facilitator superfamily (MFS) profile domain-containing protein n=1 Tax=Zasmidium cellare TaxID=395010 RepID=A0ABR0F0B5_ZASCE|nr:hypothetical protein PRZ48_000646 [Zasmidium cellare]